MTHPYLQNLQSCGESELFKRGILESLDLFAQNIPTIGIERAALRLNRSLRMLRGGLLFVPPFSCRYAFGGFCHIGGASIDWLLLKGIPYDAELTNQLREWLNAD